SIGPANSRERRWEGILHTPALLFSHRGGQHLITAPAAADVDSEPLNLLIKRRKGNHETFGGFGLVPAGALQHVNNNAAFDLIHDLKQRRLRIVRGRAGPWLAR